MKARALLVLAASAAILWIVVGLRTQNDEVRAARVDNLPAAARTPQAVRHALSLFADARRHDPDRGVPIEQAKLLLDTGHLRTGVALLREVTREEPANVVAWGYLDVYGRRVDAALGDEARARARALAPPVPPS